MVFRIIGVSHREEENNTADISESALKLNCAWWGLEGGSSVTLTTASPQTPFFLRLWWVCISDPDLRCWLAHALEQNCTLCRCYSKCVACRGMELATTLPCAFKNTNFHHIGIGLFSAGPTLEQGQGLDLWLPFQAFFPTQLCMSSSFSILGCVSPHLHDIAFLFHFRSYCQGSTSRLSIYLACLMSGRSFHHPLHSWCYWCIESFQMGRP